MADVGRQAAPICRTQETEAAVMQGALGHTAASPTLEVGQHEVPTALGQKQAYHNQIPRPVLVHWMVGFSRPVAEQDTVTSLSNSMHCRG